MDLVATNTGPLVMPDGTELPPTGKRIELKGMELVQIRDGKAAVHHSTGTTWLLPGSSVLCRRQPPDPGISGETARR